MKADDPRHGSRTGYKAGCRDECCRRPHRAALKLYRMGRAPQIIDATGTRRRIEGMLALGWTAQEIADAAGRGSRGWAHEVRKESRVVETTAQAVRFAAEQLHYQPDGKYRTRQRRIAARAGYKVPAVWLDIDDPNERPDPGYRPVQQRPTGEVLAEWDHLRSLGESIEQAAKQLGISVEAIEVALRRQGVAS